MYLCKILLISWKKNFNAFWIRTYILVQMLLRLSIDFRYIVNANRERCSLWIWGTIYTMWPQLIGKKILFWMKLRLKKSDVFCFFKFWSHPQNICQITMLNFFLLKIWMTSVIIMLILTIFNDLLGNEFRDCG